VTATRRRTGLALVVVALLFGALWWTLHGARMEHDLAWSARCHAALGRSETLVAADFTSAGLVRRPSGTRVVAYTALSSWLQSFGCVLELDPHGVVTAAHVTRMTRQETWAPGRDVPVWNQLVWPRLVAVTVPLTP
jgi:hypothetical protein